MLIPMTVLRDSVPGNLVYGPRIYTFVRALLSDLNCMQAIRELHFKKRADTGVCLKLIRLCCALSICQELSRTVKYNKYCEY